MDGQKKWPPRLWAATSVGGIRVPLRIVGFCVSEPVEGLAYVVENVLHVLNAHGEAD